MGNLHYVKAATLMAAIFSVPLVHADDMEDRVVKLERMVNARGLSQVEMQQQIDALTNDVRSLRGALEESNYKLQQVTDRQKTLYQELDKLQQAAPAPAPAPPAPVPPGAPAAGACANVTAGTQIIATNNITDTTFTTFLNLNISIPPFL